MSELKPAYLIWGDDEVKIDAWRSRLRSRVRAEGSAASLELLSGERLTAEAFAEATSALTLAVGRRYVLADGVERWREGESKLAEQALADLPPETVVVLIGIGKLAKGKGPASARLAQAVKRCGGAVHACAAPKPAALPGWVAAQARDLDLQVTRDAAQTLVERVGPNQQRLMREIEKLAVYAGGGGSIGVEQVEELAGSALEARAWELADAVVEGNRSRALTLAQELRVQGEDVMHILYSLLRQVRNCYRAWAMLARGSNVGDLQSELRVAPFVARKIAAQARRADGERLERALELLADLDYSLRGAGNLDSDTALTLTLAQATA